MIEILGWTEVAIAALATVGAALLAALLIRTSASRRRYGQLPPGPRGWPILGSLLSLGTLPHQSLYELSKEYGPLMVLSLGSVRTLVVTSHTYAREILKTHDKMMASRTIPLVARQLFYNAVDIIWMPYGQYWGYVRKICTVGLLSATRLNQFRKVREREVMSVLHFVLEESRRGSPVNMTECFSTIALNNITQMMMKESYCCLNSGSKSALRSTSTSKLSGHDLKELFEALGTFNIADYVPVLKPFDPQGLLKRAKVVHQKLDKLLQEVIDEHRERRSKANTPNYKEDFVDALLGFGETNEFQERLSMESIKAITMDMIAGAGDTSSVTALWALSQLLRHPQVLRKVQEELDSVVGVDRLVQEEDLSELPYLNAVFKETLRLCPPGPLMTPHLSSEDCEIGGFHIPAGTQVLVNAWGLHRDPAVWERPLEFDPDRFLNSATDFKEQDYEFLPFGSGRRKCPGMNLGVLMVKYPLALLLHALDWTLPDGQKPEELDMSESFGLVLYKRLPLTVCAKPRLPHHVLYPGQEVKP